MLLNGALGMREWWGSVCRFMHLHTARRILSLDGFNSTGKLLFFEISVLFG